MPTVTVVIPTYNRSERLRATVESVLNQTRPPDEIVVVDDGSTDETKEVCAGFPEPVRYVRQQNQGVSAARNRGVRESSSDWIAFVDSDDLWEPTKLEVQMAALTTCPDAGWAISRCVVVGSDNEPLPGRQGWERTFPVFRGLRRSADAHFSEVLRFRVVEAAGTSHNVYHGDVFGLLFQGNVGLPSSFVIRRDLFDEVGGFDEQLRLAEETEYFHRVAKASPVVIVMTPLVRYRTSQSDSLTANENVPQLVSSALASLDRAATLRRLTPSEDRAYRQGRERLLRRLAYAQLSLLDRAGARRTLAEAWEHGHVLTPASIALYGVTLLPETALNVAHWIKRRLPV